MGTKLQAIITQMALEIQERHAVVQGIPLVQVSDRHFWFSWPQLILHLIHFVLFQVFFTLCLIFENSDFVRSSFWELINLFYGSERIRDNIFLLDMGNGPICPFLQKIVYFAFLLPSNPKFHSELCMQYEFGLRSCFHEDFNLIILRVALGYVFA